MPASKVRGDYASLAQIAQGFGREANNSRQSLQRITSKLDVLRGGDWVGTGADKFYQEMDSAVLPAQKRLIAALEEAQRTTQKIGRIIHRAEDDAAALFKVSMVGAALSAAAGAAIGGVAGAAAGGAVGGATGAAGATGGAAAGAGGLNGSKNSLRDWAAAAAGAGAAPDARAARVQALIDAGDRQGAIDEAIRSYNIDVSAVNGSPTYSISIGSDAGVTNWRRRTIRIGPNAFTSPAILASTIGHEALHARQAQAVNGVYQNAQGATLNEVEAYDWELANAAHNGLTQADMAVVQQHRQAYYNTLTPANRRLVNRGRYGPPR